MAMGSGAVANVQSEPPLPRKLKTRPCAGFFVSAYRSFDVLFATESNGMDSSSPKRHLSAKLVNDINQQTEKRSPP